jgi:hypothetical protein
MVAIEREVTHGRKQKPKNGMPFRIEFSVTSILYTVIEKHFEHKYFKL